MPQEFITENVYCECNTFLGKFLSPRTKLGGDIGMVNVRSSDRGFRPLSGIVITQLISNFVACNCYVSVQNWFAFGQRLPNFDPLVAQKSLKIGQNAGFWPLSEKVFTQSNLNLWCTLERSIWKRQAPEQYQLIKSCDYNHKLIIWNIIVITHNYSLHYL